MQQKGGDQAVDPEVASNYSSAAGAGYMWSVKKSQKGFNKHTRNSSSVGDLFANGMGAVLNNSMAVGRQEQKLNNNGT